MVLAFVLFWLAAFGLGKIFCVYCKLKWRYTPMMALVYIIIGLDLLALISLLAGALHLLFPWTIWTILGLAAVPALFSISKIIGTTKKIIKCNRIFTFSLSLLFLFTLGSSLCYPYCWDELTYHIALPARWIMTGGVDVFLDNPYSAFPSLPQLVFRLAMECGGIKLPRMLGNLFALFYRHLSFDQIVWSEMENPYLFPCFYVFTNFYTYDARSVCGTIFTDKSGRAYVIAQR
jgi:hypothetical protein